MSDEITIEKGAPPAAPLARVPVTIVTIGEGAESPLEPGVYFAFPPIRMDELGSVELHGPYPDRSVALEAAGQFVLTAAEEEARTITNQEANP